MGKGRGPRKRRNRLPRCPSCIRSGRLSSGIPVPCTTSLICTLSAVACYIGLCSYPDRLVWLYPPIARCFLYIWHKEEDIVSKLHAANCLRANFEEPSAAKTVAFHRLSQENSIALTSLYGGAELVTYGLISLWNMPFLCMCSMALSSW